MALKAATAPPKAEDRRSGQAREDPGTNTAPLVFAVLLAMRLGAALGIRTFFQPDEYFQSLEPAWEIAFGRDSGAWITWEWREQLRSSMYPMLFAAVYRVAAQLCKLVQASPLSRAEILIAAPKVLQGCIAASGDFFTWQLAQNLYGGKCSASLATLILTLVSPWQWFCSVRTLSNSLETTLTIVALRYWPWHWFLHQETAVVAGEHGKEVSQPSKDVSERGGQSSLDSNATAKRGNPSGQAALDVPAGLFAALTAAAMACILRPTNIVIWATISICMLYRYGNLAKAIILAQSAALCGSAVLAVSLGMDRIYYGEWTFPPMKFLYFNVVQSLSVFYGANRPDYYVTEGLPLLLTTALPFAIVGMWQALRNSRERPASGGSEQRKSRFVLAMVVVVTVMAMTSISHKEVRFIYPLLPILHVLAAKPLAAFYDPFPLPASKLRSGLLLLMLAVNIYIAAYVSLVHQRGVIEVLHYLRHEQETRLPQPSNSPGIPVSANITVGFLMPCHSTPWRSHLVHPQIHAWALTCEPPISLPIADRASYQDEADIFYANPTSWMKWNMVDRKAIVMDTPSHRLDREVDNRRRAWPDYLVLFQHLEPILSEVLEGTQYKECWRGFNTHWHDDKRRHGDVIVWCLHS